MGAGPKPQRRRRREHAKAAALQGIVQVEPFTAPGRAEYPSRTANAGTRTRASVAVVPWIVYTVRGPAGDWSIFRVFRF